MKITFLFLVLFSQPASAKDVDTTLISKSEAIEIAKKNGCYIEGADWYKNVNIYRIKINGTYRRKNMAVRMLRR